MYSRAIQMDLSLEKRRIWLTLLQTYTFDVVGSSEMVVAHI